MRIAFDARQHARVHLVARVAPQGSRFREKGITSHQGVIVIAPSTRNGDASKRHVECQIFEFQ